MALDSTGTRIYYAFTTGGNENGMLLTEKTLNGTGTAVSATRTFGGILAGAGNPDRFAVLNSGR